MSYEPNPDMRMDVEVGAEQAGHGKLSLYILRKLWRLSRLRRRIAIHNGILSTDPDDVREASLEAKCYREKMREFARSYAIARNWKLKT